MNKKFSFSIQAALQVTLRIAYTASRYKNAIYIPVFLHLEKDKLNSVYPVKRDWFKNISPNRIFAKEVRNENHNCREK